MEKGDESRNVLLNVEEGDIIYVPTKGVSTEIITTTDNVRFFMTKGPSDLTGPLFYLFYSFFRSV